MCCALITALPHLLLRASHTHSLSSNPANFTNNNIKNHFAIFNTALVKNDTAAVKSEPAITAKIAYSESTSNVYTNSNIDLSFHTNRLYCSGKIRLEKLIFNENSVQFLSPNLIHRYIPSPQMPAALNSTQYPHTPQSRSPKQAIPSSPQQSKPKPQQLRHTYALFSTTNQPKLQQRLNPFTHKCDRLCELFGISEKYLIQIFKSSGCKQHKIITDAFAAAILCINTQNYGTNFTPQQILISEIKSRITPQFPEVFRQLS